MPWDFQWRQGLIAHELIAVAESAQAAQPDDVVVIEVGRDRRAPAANRGSLPQLLGLVSPTALVVVLEDLRRADRGTVELVEYLADNVSGLPALLILTLRDARLRPPWRRPGACGSRRAITYLALERSTGDQLATPVGACRPLGIQDCVGGLSCCSRSSRS